MDDGAFLYLIFSANIGLEVFNWDFLGFVFTIKCIFFISIIPILDINLKSFLINKGGGGGIDINDSIC